MKKIPFSPPDISDLEINQVIDALRSGWITTGPKTKLFEQRISDYCGTSKTVCLNSCTAALELTLRFLGIGPGDEVITSSYTYTASASVIDHVGAKIVLADIQKNSLEMDYVQVEKLITERTKAIIPVDVAGIMCDYEKIFQLVQSKKNSFLPTNDIQKSFGRIIIIADAAHSFGATYKGKASGSVADFSCFSFHVVKNLTTAEGGAITWKDHEGLINNDVYKEFQLMSLHGQNKDALAKMQLGSWEYDIMYTAYKCNMTDIAAAIGLAQLERYDYLLKRRQEIISMYNDAFSEMPVKVLNHEKSSGHLYITRIDKKDEVQRNEVITAMAKQGISCNVHYKPLPMFTAYKKLGFEISHFPNAYDFYKNEVTLPLHTSLLNDDIQYIISKYISIISLIQG